MFIHKVPKKNKDKIFISYLLRESYRENNKIKHRTIANITSWPEKLRNDFEKLLKGGEVIDNHISYKQGKSYGAIKVIDKICDEIGITNALSSDKYNKIIKLLLSGIILSPKKSKNYIANNWAKNQAIEEVFKIKKYYNEDDVYRSLDWLSKNQLKIEKTLWDKKVDKDNTKLFLYDITSSYVEGKQIALTEYGYNRDGKKGKKQIVIGLLTDINGEPVSIEVFEGATRDFKTVKKQLEKIEKNFKIKDIVFIGDRGMIKEEQIKNITEESWGYITAITKPQIEKLIKNNILQLELFDTDLCEIENEGKRYILRKNPFRAEEIKKNIEDKIKCIQKKIKDKNEYLSKGKRRSADIGLKEINEVVKKLKLNKIIYLKIVNRKIVLTIDEVKKEEELKLAGCYVLQTNIDKDKLKKETVHSRYKDLAKVESNFKALKTGFLEIRPIYVRNEFQVRGHIFACMLALKIIRYVENKLKDLKFHTQYVWESLNRIQYIIKTFKSQSFKILPTDLSYDNTLILKTLGIKFPIKM